MKTLEQVLNEIRELNESKFDRMLDKLDSAEEKFELAQDKLIANTKNPKNVKEMKDIVSKLSRAMVRFRELAGVEF